MDELTVILGIIIWCAMGLGTVWFEAIREVRTLRALGGRHMGQIVDEYLHAAEMTIPGIIGGLVTACLYWRVARIGRSAATR